MSNFIKLGDRFINQNVVEQIKPYYKYEEQFDGGVFKDTSNCFPACYIHFTDSSKVASLLVLEETLYTDSSIATLKAWEILREVLKK